MRFLKMLAEYRQKSFSCEQAAEILGISVTTFYRMRQRYEHNSLDGLADKRVGKISAKRAGVDELMRIINLYETKYYDFTVKHFHEYLPMHGVHRSYIFIKQTLQQAGVVHKALRRGAHRRKRVRRPLPGMMLHQVFFPDRFPCLSDTDHHQCLF